MYTPHYTKGLAVTPSDTVGFAPSRGLSVKTAGDYTVLYAGDTAVVTVNLAAGVIHTMSVKRVNATGGTPASVSGIVAHY
jgi:hypothetical protein